MSKPFLLISIGNYLVELFYLYYLAFIRLSLYINKKKILLNKTLLLVLIKLY